ncbi:M4 family metallopeptidase [Angustibacter sp. Root456]|uniref:M4 family metallopeptidase n=1 Tax=Angustibacter sp. Root456 TaxID=1736539 RepID=UPI000AF145B9|nr:M4 family metallopeptidase [Angustibacter sp. Root456]
MTRSRRLYCTVVTTTAAALAVAWAAPAGAASSGSTGSTGSTGSASVFKVNPVQSSGDQSLTDSKDSATAVPVSEYATVTLTNLDGSGYLRGDWANVVSETGPAAYSPTNIFTYRRDDDRFEQVMAYYWVTQAQLYLRSLGFGADLPAVNAESQDVRTNQYGVDNSYSTDHKDFLRFGKGGVDDAEDAEVIVHEYGHAVHDAQVPGFGSSLESGSIGEAFGDYLAVTVSEHVRQQQGWPLNAAVTCVADWDSTSYTRAPHCLRTLAENKHYPEDVVGEVHADGEIWSQALWSIRTALGATRADRVIVDAQFRFAPDTSFAAAAQQTVATARSMYGKQAADAVTAAFHARGIL